MYHDFDDKDGNEQVPITFDFSDLLGAAVITGVPVFTVQVKHGDDPYPQGMLSGSATVDAVANTVTVLAVGGVNGCHYLITCKVATSNGGESPELAGTLRVRKAS